MFLTCDLGSPTPVNLVNHWRMPTSNPALDIECAGLPRTDLGNAMRFAKRCGSFLRCNQNGIWQRQGSGGWHQHGARLQLQHAAAATVKRVAAEAAAIEGGRRDVILSWGFDGKRGVRLSEDLQRWAVASESASRIRAMIDLARIHLHTDLRGQHHQPLPPWPPEC